MKPEVSLSDDFPARGEKENERDCGERRTVSATGIHGGKSWFDDNNSVRDTAESLVVVTKGVILARACYMSAEAGTLPSCARVMAGLSATPAEQARG